MKIGYFYWGHLGDKVTAITKDTPDGNAWYSFTILNELHKRNHEVINMSLDRDKDDFSIFTHNIFNSFMKDERYNAYRKIDRIKWNESNWTIDNLPKLDVLLLEWRFPIEGRNFNISMNDKNFQPDYAMQTFLLNQYKDSCNIIIMDLDYKLTLEDENNLKEKCKNVTVLETSNKLRLDRPLKRRQVEIPFNMNTVILPTVSNDLKKKLVYIGSRYERDEAIEKYIIPISKKHPYEVIFYGNWRKYADKYKELFDRGWREIQYCDRVGHSDFELIYKDAVVCPLIAKQEYFERGFMTARIQEALYFGTIPVGFAEMFAIKKYLPDEVIARNADDLDSIITRICDLNLKAKNELRYRIWKQLEFMDVKYFVDVLEEINIPF